MYISRPSKLHRRKCVESTWIFRPAKLHRKKYVESTWIFRPSKSHQKSTRKLRGNPSKFGLRRIDVISTSNRHEFENPWCARWVVPQDIRESSSLNEFKSLIKFWKPDICPCRLWKNCIAQVGLI